MAGKGMSNKGGGFGPVPPSNRSGGSDDKSGKGPGGKGGGGPGGGPAGRGGKSGGMRRSQGK